MGFALIIASGYIYGAPVTILRARHTGYAGPAARTRRIVPGVF